MLAAALRKACCMHYRSEHDTAVEKVESLERAHDVSKAREPDDIAYGDLNATHRRVIPLPKATRHRSKTPRCEQ